MPVGTAPTLYTDLRPCPLWCASELRPTIGRLGGTGRRGVLGGDGPRDRTAGVDVIGLPDSVRACLFDLDGVLTRTATVHAAAWKEMFEGTCASMRYKRGRNLSRSTLSPTMPSMSTASRAT